MRYTLTISERHDDELRAAVFADPKREGAAYLLCGESRADGETRLLVHEVVPVAPEHYAMRERDRLSIASASYVPLAKRAGQANDTIVFAHSHPAEIPDFSRQDDKEEGKLMEFLHQHVPGRTHAAVVLPHGGRPRGRRWTPDGYRRIERVRVLGTRFRFYDEGTEEEIPDFFDRQVRAFGRDVQRLLHRLHVGIVGVGGTGSAVVEQLVRLGVGTVSIFDGEHFERSNVNRVYGSKVDDNGQKKVGISHGHLERIGLRTQIHTYPTPITDEETARDLCTCDIVFGCTDNETSRGILVRLSLRYLIPVIDMAVKIDSAEQQIRGVFGRVTVLFPGEACLFCRRRISADGIWQESLGPEERRNLAAQGYAPELGDPAPAVIPFTTAVATHAVMELLHRLTGFMGPDRQSSEHLLFLDRLEIKTNRPAPDPDCHCMLTQHWGKGDGERDFLGLLWKRTAGTV
jgi:molybdopterin/thiamine biosynthesis adenylyltransferase